MEGGIEAPSPENVPSELDEIDSVFVKEGNFTRFNILLHIWGILASTSICWNLVMTVFTGANPGWRCVKNCTDQFCSENANESFFVDDERYDDHCKLQRNEWIYLTNKMYSFVTEFDLICERKTLAALLSSSNYIGSIIGTFFTGMVADNFGRKPVLIATLFVFSLASFSGYYIKNIWFLFISNIVAGGSQSGCFFTLLTYSFELVAPKHRAVSNSILQTALAVSFLFIDILSFFVRDWRKIRLYSSFPCLLPFIISFAIPESPRWLLSKGKVEAAKTTLNNIIKVNKSKQMIDSLTEPTKEKSKTYKVLFRTFSFATITLSIAFVRFVVYAVYYILLLNTPYIGGDLYQSFALANIPDIVACLTYPLYANRIGRRKALIGSLMITAVFTCSMTFNPHDYPYRYFINMVLLVLAALFSVVAVTTTNTWVFEIFPTNLRARGMSICIMSDRFGILISPFVIGLFQGSRSDYSFYIACSLCVLGVVLSYCILPETRNRPTRQSIKDFKGRERKNKSRNSSTFDNVGFETDTRSS